MIIFLKSRASEPEEQIPLPEKLRLILQDRIKEAKTDEERKAAERELAKLEAG